MRYFLKNEEIETLDHTKIIDITDRVSEKVLSAGIKNGHVLIQTLHTTTGLFINEGEQFLLEDIIRHLIDNVPQDPGKYRHDDISERDCPDNEPKNGHSHLRSTLYSNNSVGLILHQGSLQLGTYQRILFAEFDGPCPREHKSKRNYLISVIGE